MVCSALGRLDLVSSVFHPPVRMYTLQVQMERLKLILLGDGAVGKTSLLITYTTNAYPSEYVPYVFDNGFHDVTVDDTTYDIALWDTGGGEDYSRLRPLAYPGTDIFLLAFSVNNRHSLENVKDYWLPEVRHHCPDTPCLMVGCKSDLRLLDTGESNRPERPMTYAEASEVAENLGLRYVETSSLKQIGLAACFQRAVRVALEGKQAAAAKKKKGRFSLRSRKGKEPPPPVMPPAGKAPIVEMEASTFADNWYKMLENPRFHDVTFVVEGSCELRAHKIMVRSASQFFARVLQSPAAGKCEGGYSHEELNSGQVAGIVAVRHGDQQVAADDRLQPVKPTTVVLSQDVKESTFCRLLEFLYTGAPRFADDVCEADIEDVSRVAGVFHLPHLQTVCANVESGESYLNASIATFVTDQTAATLKALFFNQPHTADVVFNVQGCSVYAHRAVLSAQSEVMAAMFSGHFSEGNNEETSAKVNIPSTPLDTFLALLEYLYTNHAPIEEGDSVGILMLADEYCVRRLCTLCEFYISREVERRHCSSQKLDIDVVALLNTAEMHNAKQLVRWCLHFICVNFRAFERRKEFASMTEEHRSYVTEHQWPPLSYFEEVEQFEEKIAKKKGKCVVM
ncbi:hypothetical protein ACOMHN_027617 [Nucella lapillus]